MIKKKPASPLFPNFKSMPKITIVDQEQAQKADMIVCIRVVDAAPASMFIKGQRIGKCTNCGEKVLMSPGSPVGVPPLCLVCYDARPEEPDTQMHVTNATLAEFAEAVVAHAKSLEPLPEIPSDHGQSDSILPIAKISAKGRMLQ